MTMIHANMLKTVVLVLILFSWKIFDTSCTLFVVTLSITTFFLTMIFAEGRLLYRKSLANAVFKEGTLFYTWFSRKWFVLLLSFIKALILGILLLVSMMHWSEQIALAMFSDIVLILGLYKFFTIYFAKHTQNDVTNLVARRSTIIANITIIIPVLTVIMLYSQPPQFVDSSIVQTVANAKERTVDASCQVISFIQTYDNVREGLEWWAMYKASSYFESSMYLIAAWALFLIVQTFYVWVFSQLILSATVSWEKIFSKIGKYKLDHFSIGFFGIIVLFVVITLTFMPDELIPEPVGLETNRTTIPSILDTIDKVTKEEHNTTVKAVNSYIDTEVSHVFQSVYANIPAYTDKQYTWYRDYISIYQVAVKKISDAWEIWKYKVNKYVWNEEVVYPSLNATKSYAQKSRDEIQQVLFGDGEFDRQIYALQMRINDYTQKQITQSKDNLLHAIVKDENITLSASDLEQLQSIKKTIEEPFLKAKNSLEKTAMAYKVGQAGVTIVLTKTILVKLLAKSGVKAVAKTGTFLGGAATGLAVCAPSGPWAIVCGAATGTLTWIGVDFAVSEIDEVLTREAFEAKLRSGIKKNEEAFKLKMQESYIKGLDEIFSDLSSAVHSRPIDVIHRN